MLFYVENSFKRTRRYRSHSIKQPGSVIISYSIVRITSKPFETFPDSDHHNLESRTDVSTRYNEAGGNLR